VLDNTSVDAMSLVGVLLFVHTNVGGSRLVLRYPPILRAEVSRETMTHFKLRDSANLHLAEAPEKDWSDPFSMPSVNLVGFIPVNELRDQPMQITVNETTFLGHPTTLVSGGIAPGAVRESDLDEDLAPLVLGSFNVVFAVKHCGEGEMEMLRRCVHQICTVCKREEARVGYLTEQCRNMFRVREAWLRAQQDPDVTARPSHAALAGNLLSCSSLARELEQIHLGLSKDGIAHVKIGGWTTLSLSTHSISDYPSYPIRPYQTLLITNASLVPTDASSELLRFVSVCKPSKSFQDLQMELNVPLSQIFRMAAHLLYWRIGKIVSTMATTNVYCIHPALTVSHELVKQFEADFPAMPSLLRQLERFSVPKPLKDHLAEISVSQKQFSDILVWMLRRDVVLQLCTYLLLVVPESFSGDAAAMEAAALAAASSSDGRLLPADKVKLSPLELAYVQSVTAEKTQLDLLFLRLCAYARGGHHLEEILWRENIAHSDVQAVLTNPKYFALSTITR
jgi:hypothetical protein